MANKITVIGLERQFKKFEKYIQKDALVILKILNKDNVAVDIYLAGNALMRRLNKEHRGKDKTANVLSFVEPLNFPHPETKTRFLGEIYLDTQTFTDFTLTNTEKSQHKSVSSQHGSVYLIHAILHLLGYTHKGKSDRIKMEKKENHVHHLFRHRNFAN